MGALRVFAAIVAVMIAAPARADLIERWRPYIGEASVRFGIPEDWIVRVMRAESGGRTALNGRPITSRAGAMGLMQLMPETWAEMRIRHGLGVDPHAPRDNILAGTAYLRAMYERFGYPGLFAAYNAGPARYEAHIRSQKPLPAETRVYLARVAATGEAPAEKAAVSDADSLFFALSQDRKTAAAATSNQVSAGLFVPLRSAAGKALEPATAMAGSR